MRAQRERHANRPLCVRALFVVAGFTLLFAGHRDAGPARPALAVIPVALAILSLEFAWAGRALEKAIEQAEKAKQTGQGDQPLPADRGRVATVLAIAAAIVASILWEIPIVPYT